MSTMMGNMRRAILTGAVSAVIALFALGVARADVTSDRPGAVLIFPKIVVDTSGVFGPRTDTELQLTNTSDSVVSARCFLVDATSHCSNNPRQACTPETEASGTPRCTGGGVCLAGWATTDFRLTLTKRQPIAWKASDGLDPFPCDGLNDFCHDNQSNKGSDGSLSRILSVQEDPFFGEMKCVEVDPSTFEPTIGFNPANNAGGDLKAEVTIVSKGSGGTVDARKYNAIALESTTFQDGDPDTLVVGGPGAEYNGCPNVLILDHFFDGAVIHTHGRPSTSSASVTTDLTVVPCGEDLSTSGLNSLTPITLQFLVFNEFEQRFSTSTNFSCFREIQLSDIDTRVGPFGNSQSIFSVAVEGTLSGQTRIRSVAGPNSGNTIVGIAEEFWTGAGPNGRFTDATNIHFTGTRDQGDTIVLHPDSTP
jgi:hypothetical protein